MIVLTLVVVIAVLAVTGVSLAVWISGDGEGASYDFEVMGWDDPSVRYLRFSAKGEGGEDSGRPGPAPGRRGPRPGDRPPSSNPLSG